MRKSDLTATHFPTHTFTLGHFLCRNPQWSIKISGAPPSCKAARIQSTLTVNTRALVIDFLIDFSDWSAICNLSILSCSERHKHGRRIGGERFERPSSRNNLFIGGNSFKEELRVEQRKALRERSRRFIHRLWKECDFSAAHAGWLCEALGRLEFCMSSAYNASNNHCKRPDSPSRDHGFVYPAIWRKTVKIEGCRYSKNSILCILFVNGTCNRLQQFLQTLKKNFVFSKSLVACIVDESHTIATWTGLRWEV